MKLSVRAMAIVIVLIVLFAGVERANATPIVAPVSGTTTMGAFFPLSNAFNQSGLSATYISGVTDFATFTAVTTHNSQPNNDYTSTTTTGNVTFDLGSVMSIDKIAFWNFGGLAGNPALAVTQFTLVSSVDAAFTTPIVLGTFNPAVFGTGLLNPAQVFSFAPTNAEFFRLQAFTANGSTAGLGIGEVAFNSTSVPEPASLFLLGTGVAVAAARRRFAKRT
jgi:PEP-CTERM motif